MSLVLRKPVFRFMTRSDTNRAVQPQKMARGLKFPIKVVDGLYYPFSENKGTDQLAVTAKLSCVFVFAYAKIRFSHDEARIKVSFELHVASRQCSEKTEKMLKAVIYLNNKHTNNFKTSDSR